MRRIENIEEIFHFPAVGSVFSRIHMVKIYGQHFGSGNAALLLLSIHPQNYTYCLYQTISCRLHQK